MTDVYIVRREFEVKVFDRPWSIVKKEAHNRGCYLLLLRLKEDTVIDIGIRKDSFQERLLYLRRFGEKEPFTNLYLPSMI